MTGAGGLLTHQAPCPRGPECRMSLEIPKLGFWHSQSLPLWLLLLSPTISCPADCFDTAESVQFGLAQTNLTYAEVPGWTTPPPPAPLPRSPADTLQLVLPSCCLCLFAPLSFICLLAPSRRRAVMLTPRCTKIPAVAVYLEAFASRGGGKSPS